MISPCIYDQNQIIESNFQSTILQLNCVNCNIIDNISVSNSLNQYDLQKLVGNFLCRQCLQNISVVPVPVPISIPNQYCNNNYNSNQINNKRGKNNFNNLKEEFNKFKAYSLGFNGKQFDKILKEVNSNLVSINTLLNFKDRDKIRRRSDDLNLKLKLLELKKVIGKMIDNSKENINEKNKSDIDEKYLILENIINKVKEENYEIIDTMNKKSKLLKRQYEKSINLIKLLVDKISNVENDLNSINKQIEENKALIIFTNEEIINKSTINFSEFDNELNSLRDEIKSLKLGSKEIKEMKNLRYHLILNDKEYKKVKIDLKKFNEGMYYIYAFIFINILSILSLFYYIYNNKY